MEDNASLDLTGSTSTPSEPPAQTCERDEVGYPLERTRSSQGLERSSTGASEPDTKRGQETRPWIEPPPLSDEDRLSNGETNFDLPKIVIGQLKQGQETVSSRELDDAETSSGGPNHSTAKSRPSQTEHSTLQNAPQTEDKTREELAEQLEGCNISQSHSKRHLNDYEGHSFSEKQRDEDEIEEEKDSANHDLESFVSGIDEAEGDEAEGDDADALESPESPDPPLEMASDFVRPTVRYLSRTKEKQTKRNQREAERQALRRMRFGMTVDSIPSWRNQRYADEFGN